jgi:hypothetical protein
MKITWIDKNSVLAFGKSVYRVGDIVPEGILPKDRLDKFVKSDKIMIGDPKIDNTKKTTKIFGLDVESKITGKPLKKKLPIIPSQEVE